ncbi:SsgA family sporulation/cell division regulator [Streptomyces sp. NBC_01498]|uniref:SsgA family sporulation/cell division regulator n=1 Tax=Streptomyces sp. NBC_01498 TaxID=2975870 RepID=UPI002E7B00F1|nr:SsgA family sporulation/cell division regulator [Streptomyces sp. NBC_01498]
MPAVVEQPAKVRVITDAPDHACLSVTLRYDSADPLAVRVVFPAEVSRDSGEVVWTFARELLEAGLRTPSGDGDVRVWPCGRAQTMLEFHSPEGVALTQFDTAPLRRFLRMTYETVPVGEERYPLRAKRGLDRLLHPASDRDPRRATDRETVREADGDRAPAPDPTAGRGTGSAGPRGG